MCTRGTDTRPAVGASVHYRSLGYLDHDGKGDEGALRAATITEVDDPGDPESAVSLAILNPERLYFRRHVRYGPGRPGCWSWPGEG
jgi:hypothetical protein